MRYQVRDMRHVMKIGPVELENGSASAYVAFGESGLDVVLEATDDKGLAALRRTSRSEPLVCEPALSPSATVHGLAVGRLPPEALAVKAALAVSLEHGPVMEHVAPQLVIELIVALIEFDAAGNVVHSWGDLNVIDSRLHSCHFDPEGNVWIGSSPSGMVQKYTHDGSKLLLQLGKKGVFDSSDGTAKGKPLNSNAAAFYMPSSIFVDRTNGDVYVSDGEGAGGNRRIAVMDKTGKFLRQWQPTDMDMVHCMTMAKDGLVYVCNRTGSKIQVYDKMGSLKRMIDVPWTPVTPPKDGKLTQSGGSAVAIDFSPDQRLMFVINQNNSEVDIIDRQSGQKVTSFGRPGSFAGQFNQPHGIAVDSKGNVYIAENRGKRIHKFRPVT
jgi:sugar lactone lactonase YvrE